MKFVACTLDAVRYSFDQPMKVLPHDLTRRHLSQYPTRRRTCFYVDGRCLVARRVGHAAGANY